MFRHDTHRFDCERLGAIAREHGDHHVANNVELGSVGGSDLDKDILGIERDLGVIAVDYGRQRAHDAVGVVDDRIHLLVADNMQVTAEVLVGLVKGHKLRAGHLFGLVEWHKLDVLGHMRLVREGALDGVEVVSTDGDAVCD